MANDEIYDVEDMDMDADIQRKQELIEEIKSLESENGKIIAAFVQDPNYKRILELRYLSYKRWEEIAVSMGYTFRWTQMLHARALQQLKDNAAKNSAA